VHGVQAVAKLGVVAWEQVAVAVQREADGGVADPDADLLGVGARCDPQRDRGMAKVVRAQRYRAGRTHGAPVLPVAARQATADDGPEGSPT
jgi:hypothetical protein